MRDIIERYKTPESERVKVPTALLRAKVKQNFRPDTAEAIKIVEDFASGIVKKHRRDIVMVRQRVDDRTSIQYTTVEIVIDKTVLSREPKRRKRRKKSNGKNPTPQIKRRSALIDAAIEEIRRQSPIKDVRIETRAINGRTYQIATVEKVNGQVFEINHRGGVVEVGENNKKRVVVGRKEKPGRNRLLQEGLETLKQKQTITSFDIKEKTIGDRIYKYIIAVNEYGEKFHVNHRGGIDKI